MSGKTRPEEAHAATGAQESQSHGPGICQPTRGESPKGDLNVVSNDIGIAFGGPRSPDVMEENSISQLTGVHAHCELLEATNYVLDMKHRPTGDLKQLEEGIKCHHRMLLLADNGVLGQSEITTSGQNPEESTRRLRFSNSLANLLISRFLRLGNLLDLEGAIKLYEEGVNQTPDSHPDKVACLNNLGNSWFHRFRRLGQLGDIDRAIKCQQQVIDLTPDNDPHMPDYLESLGTSWSCKFGRLGDPEDIDRAIACQMKSVALTPDSFPDKAISLNNLGNSWLRRFQRLGDVADIDKAIECQTKAVDLTQDNRPEKLSRLSNLGISLLRRFEQLGHIADLDKAISFQAQAVSLQPASHPNKSIFLSNLGNSWMRRFQRLGNIEDIDKAISCRLQAANVTPDNHPEKPTHLSNLGTSLSCRFERLGDIEDIDKAIACQARAVDFTPERHRDKPGRLNNLGSSYLRRFQRSKNLADIDRAIECRLQTVNLTPESDPGKSGRLSNLGDAWLRRFEHLEDIADIDRAIGYQVQAVECTPDSHPNKPSYLSNLGNSLFRRFERTGNIEDIDNAMARHVRAVDLTPDNHPDKPSWLNNLGQSHSVRYAVYNDRSDLETACTEFRRAATLPLVNPRIQLTNAREWASACLLLDLSPLEAFQTAFTFLPSLVWLGQTMQARYSIISSINDLVPEATSWAISVQSYDLALEWLEQGCSVIWRQTLQLRTLLEDLALVDSQLANELKDLAAQLDSAASATGTPTNTTSNSSIILEDQAQYQHKIALRWEKLLMEARQLPGFHDLLKPTKAQKLKEAARDGPIVLINTHITRCDALVILPQVQDMIHVPLPNISPERLKRMSRQSSKFNRSATVVRGFTRNKSNDNLEMLTSLWPDVVEPILKSLPINEQPNVLPHVTWCTAGALSSLPLHAAGLYNERSPKAFDLVVSSYTPTIGALLASVTSTHEQEPNAGLLAVGQDASAGPGLGALPKTAEELKIIEKHVGPSRFHQLTGAAATVSATLNAMEAHRWVHFACHATQDRSNPQLSGFHLHDGMLTLEEIAKRAFKNKGLAFLSACQTAMGDQDLPNEATHLAAGMLTAGYTSVVATLWSIGDKDAPVVADGVYGELLKDGKMDSRDTARALHKAVGVLRQKVGVKAVEKWAPFIHMGI